MEKSYVTLEQHACPVCLKTFDTGNLLLDDELRDVFEKDTITGYELCEEHKKVVEDGYVILVEVRERPQKGQDPYRTGTRPISNGMSRKTSFRIWMYKMSLLSKLVYWTSFVKCSSYRMIRMTSMMKIILMKRSTKNDNGKTTSGDKTN